MGKIKYKEINIVHQDEDVIIVNKPAHVLSIPDRYNPDLPNLYSYFKRKHDTIMVTHRLDKETSGIICFAKNAAAHKFISQQFSKHTVAKTYHALVQGRPLEQEGTIDLPLAENPAKRGTMKVDKREGKHAISHYQVLEEFNHYTYIAVKIETGRMHQIRVHLKAVGHPLAVDAIYGNQKGFYLSTIKHKYQLNRHGIERPIIGRVSLHAYSLSLVHPSSGETVTYSAELPKDMHVALKQLRKYNALGGF